MARQESIESLRHNVSRLSQQIAASQRPPSRASIISEADHWDKPPTPAPTHGPYTTSNPPPVRPYSGLNQQRHNHDAPKRRGTPGNFPAGPDLITGEEAVDMATQYEMKLLQMQKEVERSRGEANQLKSVVVQRDQELLTQHRQLNSVHHLEKDLDASQWENLRHSKETVDAQYTIRRLESQVARLTEDKEKIVRDKHNELDRLTAKWAAKERELQDGVSKRDEKIRHLQADLKAFNTIKLDPELTGPTPETPEKKQDMISKCRALVEQKHAEVVRLQSITKEQRRQLNSLQDQISADSKVRELDEVEKEQERDELILLQRKVLKEKDEEIRNLSQLVTAQKGQLQMLQNRASTSVEDEELLLLHRRTLSAKDAEINHLKGQLSDFRTKYELVARQHQLDKEHLTQMEDRAQREATVRLASTTFERNAHRSQRLSGDRWNAAPSPVPLSGRDIYGGSPLDVARVALVQNDERIAEMRRQLALEVADKEKLKSYLNPKPADAQGAAANPGLDTTLTTSDAKDPAPEGDKLC